MARYEFALFYKRLVLQKALFDWVAGSRPVRLFAVGYPVSGAVFFYDDFRYLCVSQNGGYMILRDLFPDVEVDGSAYWRGKGSVNGHSWHQGAKGYLFRSIRGVAVLFGSLREPYAFKNDDDEWEGDGWYEGSGTTLSPKGTLLNDGVQALTVEVKQNRYSSGSGKMFGEYAGEGDQQGKVIVFGEPYWEDENKLKYVRHFAGGGAERYTNTSYVSSRYVIGSHGSEGGWWEASGTPTAKSSWTFSFTKPPGSEAEDKPDITLAWGGWTEGVTPAELMIGGRLALG